MGPGGVSRSREAASGEGAPSSSPGRAERVVWLTLSPKVAGNSACEGERKREGACQPRAAATPATPRQRTMSREIRVPFPTPLGPQKTSGGGGEAGESALASPICGAAATAASSQKHGTRERKRRTRRTASSQGASQRRRPRAWKRRLGAASRRASEERESRARRRSARRAAAQGAGA